MSRSKPIPSRNRAAFFEWMQLFDNDELNDGAQQHLLVEQAEEFMLKHRMKYGDPHSAWLQYEKMKLEKK